MGVPEREERERRKKLKEIIVESFQNLLRNKKQICLGSTTNSKWDKWKDTPKQTHHPRYAESKRQREKS